ncbi:DUF1501 domain-containing protein [Enterovibrio sp. ZSDZ42]|uniref:DUF1501 domain-containing protein n=1 Tax=Enterovibrio gelatinilyticus TaxID=2899819 RepID=A0ABT5R4V9_9GAMM|nr:DUF1501 domain-containing protein [Enterovibrio sp. ZSDZ42]MDD1795288.1 DUF1501 domain-containing protein [Enterovibrio sp. ZSDZ42]
MKVTRRNFVRGIGATGLATMVPSISFNVNASTNGDESNGDYKALICVFLKGGNDFFHQVVPNVIEGDNNVYSKYTQRRSAFLPTSESTNEPTIEGQYWDAQLKDENGKSIFIHNDMSELSTLFQTGNANVVLNVGTLLQDTNNQNLSTAKLPSNLFAHNKQQEAWQRSFLNSDGDESKNGWLGRAIDEIQDDIDGAISNNFYGGPHELMDSEKTEAVYLSKSGFDPLRLSFGRMGTYYQNIFGINYLHSPSASSVSHPSPLTAAYANAMKSAHFYSDKLRSIFSSSDVQPDESISYKSGNTESNFALQLRAVRQMIQARKCLGGTNGTRQVFFVELGGFDTHAEQELRQSDLMKEFSTVTNLFYASLGTMKDSVMTGTLSEFGRTMHTNDRNGTDHGWGGGQFLFGPTVAHPIEDDIESRRCFGKYPDFDEASDDDNGEGRLIPKISHEEYAGYMLNWLGLEAHQIQEVFPLLRNDPHFEVISASGVVNNNL